MSNILGNWDFEGGGVSWTLHMVGSGVADDNSTGDNHTPGGSHCAITDTTAALTLVSQAGVRQSLTGFGKKVSDLPDQSGTLVAWMKLVDVNPDGGADACMVRVQLSGGKILNYYWRLRSQTLPTDGADIKYIDMGTTLSSSWWEFTRNLKEDIIAKHGSSPDRDLEEVALFSLGEEIIGTDYGEEVAWDDVELNLCAEQRTVDDGAVERSIVAGVLQKSAC